MAKQQFLAKIQLKRTGPLTYTGRGRTFKRGVTIITTTDPVEADYFRSQWGFSVEIKKGKLAAPVSKPAPDDNEVTEREDEEAEEEEEERDEAVSEFYEEADLKKMKKDELVALIDDDDDLDMKSSDLPKKAGKPEIIEAILEAQGDPEEEDDEEDEDDEDEG